MASTQWPHASVDLPISLTPLIGRERETATLVSMLGQHDARLLTVTGPGGVGKTRLALHVAADVGAAFPDGVVFVDLATVTDPALVAPVVAAVLGVREASGQPLVDQVRAFLRDKRLLLVLDNFEQVVEAAPLVVTLLAGCPGLAVLATSRVRLRVSGEREYPLSPLGLPDDGGQRPVDALRPSEAVRLFVARAQAVQPDFALSPANAVVVADICRRLDGLPLAIELAAARIKSLSVSALLSRMESRLPLLTGGGRDLPLRQQTMRDTIAWSYDLLSPEEQTQFQRLAVFVGGFSLEAAEAVAEPGGSGTVFDIISSLLDSSLLLKQEAGDGESRFRMLETIREFGLERLTASGAEAPVRQAHAAWYLALAEAAESSMRGGAAQARWLDRLEADHPNLRAALTWFEQTGDAEGGARLAGTLQGYWLQRSHRSEGRAWLERALAHGVVTNEARAKALLALAVLSQLTGSSEATALLAQSLAFSRSAADSRRAAVA